MQNATTGPARTMRPTEVRGSMTGNEAWLLGHLTSADVDIIALGRKAGRECAAPETCPHAPYSREASLWHFGREAV